MSLLADYEMVTLTVEMDVGAKYEPYNALWIDCDDDLTVGGDSQADVEEKKLEMIDNVVWN